MAQETGKIKRNRVRLISLALVVVLLLILLLFHRQINNFFLPLKPPAASQLKPALTVKPVTTPGNNTQEQTPTPSAKIKPNKPDTSSILLNKHGFTIQLMGVYDFNELTKFVAANKLQGKSYIFHSISKGQDWYTLIYGIYPTHEQAKEALAQLPEALKQLKPWVRSMDSVHNVILQNKRLS